MNRTIEIDKRFVMNASGAAGRLGQKTSDPYEATREFLTRHQVPNSAYALEDPDCDERLCFHFENDLWVYYHSERGVRTGGAFFTDWSTAIRSFAYYLGSVYADQDFPKISDAGVVDARHTSPEGQKPRLARRK